MDKKDISIIIVSYNNFDLLKNCVKSIYKYTQDLSYEIIIVDNNSSEGDVSKLFNEYENLIIIKNEINTGFAAANNQGVKAASGKFILLLNNDTELVENSIKIISDYYSEQNQKTIIACKLLNKDMSHQISVVDFDNLINLFGENFFLYLFFKKSMKLNKYHYNYQDNECIINVDVVKGALMFLERKYFNELNGFDEKFFFYNEENDLCKRFVDAGGKVIYFPLTKVIHHGGATTSKNLEFQFYHQNKSKLVYFGKHFNGISYLLVLLMHYIGLLIRVPIYLLIGILKRNRFNFMKAKYFLKGFFYYTK